MNQIIRERLDDLSMLCKKYRVRRLDLFGSAVDDQDFDDLHSDLDFLVEFLPLETGEWADAYFGLQESLEDLFQRPVDLVMIKAIQNPYFLASIQNKSEALYAA